ncbi:PTS transporter subunit IIC [uncultured Flavonifractor sp.]|uniref:PTS transporter subunit IIC n=1 Tax=uncultured Flavonifractor sp. TaxID=1193534 RepID=UPI00261F2C25|nr:PTS transporter subunit IIC [uncultured Flavonifractor sp.]
MQAVFDFIINDVLKQTPIFMGLIACVGLLVQRKAAKDVIEGTLKTIVGMAAFNLGVNLLCTAILAINDILKPTLSTSGVYPFPDIATGVAYTFDIVAQNVIQIMIIAWFIHILLVRIFHKWFKCVYLTVHMMINQSAINILFWHFAMGLEGIPMYVACITVDVIYFTVSPMLTYKEATEMSNGAFALGHLNQFGAWAGAKLGRLVGDPVKDNADRLKLPGWLSMFGDMTLNLAITMPISFLIIGIIAIVVGNPEAMAVLDTNRAGQNAYLWLIMQGINFAAGVVVLIYGLRMFIASLIPAFRGFTEKLLPGCVPALDCMVFCPYSQMGATLGFLGNAAAAIICCVCLAAFGCPVFVYPSLAICFFDGATEGVFGNHTGGWKGALLAGFVGGLVLHLGVLLLNPLTGPLAEQGVQYGNFDTSSFNAILFFLIHKVGGLFGLG